MNKVKAKQQRLKREYMKYYRKLGLYAQEPLQPLVHPWQRDIERLKNRWEYVKQYVRVYTNYKRAVDQFNSEYLQNIKIRDPHLKMIPQTIETIKREYDQFKKLKRRFINKIQNESDLIYNNLKKQLRRAYDYSAPTHFTSAGEMTPHQITTAGRANKFQSFMNEIIPEYGIERYNALKNIKKNWDLLQSALDVFFYDSDGERVAEAWAQIVTILTGDGLRETDLYYSPEEDFLHE